MRKKMSFDERKASLLRLQREYIKESIRILDSMVPLAEDLPDLRDPAMIEAYMDQLSELEKLVKKNYDIARSIEEKYEHLCRKSGPVARSKGPV
jgi:hypothetical protein